jgi:hypothetical protein
MCLHYFKRSCRANSQRRRRGLSLAELLIAVAILVFVAGGIAALTATIDQSNRQGQGQAIATQHARVALERIERTLRQAVASPEYPGFVAISETVGGYKYPDTLVVWRPASGAAANPLGRPLFSELVIFRVDPSQPNVLSEITVAGDNRTTPPTSDSAAWVGELAALRGKSTYQAVTLTDLLRTASTNDDPLSTAARRGVVRFEVERSPSDAEVADYRSGKTAWKDLPWCQGIYGAKGGLAQAKCRIELQLMPGKQAQANDPTGATAIPFFGSAAIYYQVTQ